MSATLLPLTRRALLLSALSQPLSIGGIRFTVEQNGNSSRRYLHIHGNETTARDVLKEHLKTFPGTYFFIENSRRNAPVGDCLIDPNRMFTAAGARKSLERFNQNSVAIDAAMALLDRDREAFLKAVSPPPGGILIAMHNNADGYSMNDEIPISDAVHQPDKSNPRDFLLATNPADFAKIERGPYNSVLQKSVRSDDGSFSVLAASRSLRYVNIEAAIGNFDKQRSMIRFLEQVLS